MIVLLLLIDRLFPGQWLLLWAPHPLLVKPQAPPETLHILVSIQQDILEWYPNLSTSLLHITRQTMDLQEQLGSLATQFYRVFQFLSIVTAFLLYSKDDILGHISVYGVQLFGLLSPVALS